MDDIQNVSAFQVHSALKKITNSYKKSTKNNNIIKNKMKLKRLQERNKKIKPINKTMKRKKKIEQEEKFKPKSTAILNNETKNKNKTKNIENGVQNLSKYMKNSQNILDDNLNTIQDDDVSKNFQDSNYNDNFVTKKNQSKNEKSTKNKNKKKHSVNIEDNYDTELHSNKKLSSSSGKNILKRNSSEISQNEKNLSKKGMNKFVESASDITQTLSDSVANNESLEENSNAEIYTSPYENSLEALKWLLYPVTIKQFLENFWEKKPLFIRRHRPNYYNKPVPLASTDMIDKILRQNNIQYTRNIDISTYYKGVRETHNPEGRAYPSVVWDYYLNDCSVRLLNPQTYIPSLHQLNSTLQEYFGCLVGSNLYLTPPNSQGFAPHYDDIEAFILQIEGKKRWRLYKPKKEERLARYSSKNFTEEEIGEPFLDIVLNKGDLLYFPRGTIHQGQTIDNMHSLHITLSVYQKNSWADFMMKLLPEALETATKNNVKFRAGLPIGYWKNIGSVYTDKKTSVRTQFISNVETFMKRLMKYIDVDKAADELFKDCIHDFLPPVLNEDEKECSILEDGEKMLENGQVIRLVEIEPDTEIRLIREHCVRLAKNDEDDNYTLYFSTQNSKVYHEFEIQQLTVDNMFFPATKEIIRRYPQFIRVEDLPVDGLNNKIQLAKDLWEANIVVTKYPLPYDED